MGKVVVTEFVTLDGVAQAPGAPDEDREEGFPYGGWQAPLLDEEAGATMFERASSMDALLLGRKTYEIFAGYWPTASEESPFTGLLNSVPKYVASRSLTEPMSWQNSKLLGGDLSGEIRELKNRHNEVHVIGSLNLLQSLLRERLVDRLDLWLYPIVLGQGKRVFGDGVTPTNMRLVESATRPNGSLLLSYEPVGEPTFGTVGE